MYVKHYVSKAFMKSSDLDSSFIAGIFQLLFEVLYEIFWGFWHISSDYLALDTATIYFQNWQFYKRNRMTFKDCKKADLLTLRIYESLLDTKLFTNNSKEKQYYSFLHDRYFEMIKLPRVYTCVYHDMKQKNKQRLFIEFNGAQVKSIESDEFLTALNQVLASVDNNLTAQMPDHRSGWLIYKIKDDSVNYRINLVSDDLNELDGYKIFLDHGHVWDLKKNFGGILVGPSGFGKSMLLTGIIDQVLKINKRNKKNDPQNFQNDKEKIDLFVGDGKNDVLGSMCNVILPEDHTYVGTDVFTLIHTMYEEMVKRYKYMSCKRKKNPRKLASADFEQLGLNMIVCIIDEQAVVLESLEKKQAKQYVSELTRLAQAARAAGIVLIISMQQASVQAFGNSAIREQLNGCRIVMGPAKNISTENKNMVFETGTILPPSKHADVVGTGYVQTASMPAPEEFQSPLLPTDHEKLFDLLLKDSNRTL